MERSPPTINTATNCGHDSYSDNLGAEQIAWLKSDLAGLSASTPIVVFAHIPLWMVYEKWGWGTADGSQALALLKRFGSVTVLNGHIHQVVQKVEGNVAFHTAMATAFPQPVPGTAPNPGPMTVPAGKLQSVLMSAAVTVIPTNGPARILFTNLRPAYRASSKMMNGMIQPAFIHSAVIGNLKSASRQ